MANEQKDRLGDKLRELERAHEEDYFARRNRELLEKMKKRGRDGEEAEPSGDDKKEGER